MGLVIPIMEYRMAVRCKELQNSDVTEMGKYPEHVKLWVILTELWNGKSG